MREFNIYRFLEIRRPYRSAFRIGLLTAAVILLFQAVNLLVMYRYMKLDLYLCLVAVFFLAMGLLMNRRRGEGRIGEKIAIEPEFPVHSGNETPKAQPGTENPLGKTVDIAGVMESLSAKEWQILKLVAEGKTNKEIAAAQFIELSTVKTHLNNIYGKLSVRNRNEARAIYAEIAPRCPVVV